MMALSPCNITIAMELILLSRKLHTHSPPRTTSHSVGLLLSMWGSCYRSRPVYAVETLTHSVSTSHHSSTQICGISTQENTQNNKRRRICRKINTNVLCPVTVQKNLRKLIFTGLFLHHLGFVRPVALDS